MYTRLLWWFLCSNGTLTGKLNKQPIGRLNYCSLALYSLLPLQFWQECATPFHAFLSLQNSTETCCCYSLHSAVEYCLNALLYPFVLLLSWHGPHFIFFHWCLSYSFLSHPNILVLFQEFVVAHSSWICCLIEIARLPFSVLDCLYSEVWSHRSVSPWLFGFLPFWQGVCFTVSRIFTILFATIQGICMVIQK